MPRLLYLVSYSISLPCLGRDATTAHDTTVRRMDTALLGLTVAGGLLNLFACLMAAFVVVSLLSKTTRHSSFNIYIVGVLLPDVVVNLNNAVASIVLVLNSGSYTTGACVGRNVLMLVNLFTNIYLNAVVAQATYKLMQDSHQRKRTRPPLSVEPCGKSLPSMWQAGSTDCGPG